MWSRNQSIQVNFKFPHKKKWCQLVHHTIHSNIMNSQSEIGQIISEIPGQGYMSTSNLRPPKNKGGTEGLVTIKRM